MKKISNFAFNSSIESILKQLNFVTNFVGRGSSEGVLVVILPVTHRTEKISNWFVPVGIVQKEYFSVAEIFF